MAWTSDRRVDDDDRRDAFLRAAGLYSAEPEFSAALQSLAELGALVADVCIVQDLEQGGGAARVAVGLAGASPALEAMIGDRLQASSAGLFTDRPRGVKLVAERDYVEVAGDAGSTLRELRVTSGLLLPIVVSGRPLAIVGLFSRDGASLPDAEVVRLLSDRAEHCFLPRVVELSSHAAADLVDDALLRMRPLARERGLILRRRMKYRGPVLCHRERSLEVLASLVENAVKVTERGRVIVGVDREGACARFLVENTGPGILPSSELHRVRALVEAQSGTLSVESEIGHGSRFEFMLRIP